MVTAYQETGIYSRYNQRNAVGLRIELATPSEIVSSSAVETTENKTASVESEISDSKKSVTVGISPNSIVSVKMIFNDLLYRWMKLYG